MTTPQVLAFLIIAGMMVAFILGRWRYDLVAICALLAAMLVGVVPAERAFVGFANDIVIIVGSALVVSAALSAMGMAMLPPSLVSLPFKLLLFVAVDGWYLVVSSLVRSFH